MVASLTAITVVVGALLGLVNDVTKDPIAEAAKAKQQAAILAVVPGENVTVGDVVKAEAPNGTEAEIYEVTSNGQLLGKAVKATSKNGFGGNIVVMFGFNPAGDILGYSVLDCSNETPGLGAKMPDWFQKGQKGDVIGKNPGKNNLTVSKDGGEVDAITAATISSRAFLDALAQATAVFAGKKGDATTSASQQVKETPCHAEDNCCQADSAACCEKAVEECCGKCKENVTE